MDATLTQYSARQGRDGFGGGFEITSDTKIMTATPPPPPATTPPPTGAVFWVFEQRLSCLFVRRKDIGNN